MRTFHLAFALLLCGLLSGCASLSGRDPLQIDLAGIRPLPGQELEMRFLVRLRVINPNDTAVSYRGIALALDVNGKPLARGVSDQSGQVPRFGEVLLDIPMSVSAFSVSRQLWSLSATQPASGVPYRLHGKLAGGPFGSSRFSNEGTLDWPPAERP
ncbi:LEA type 2 family protein [Pseudomonas mangrovi]|uniref:Water stress/hypersensitive response domain-containing protein n=1 Tax=Pseudomonas mangrovi TaxID=2161748 RepID=A0A2T5PF56_9PSED|nr:LEA type 2 family protein [Pseudomonas mangrovi]PTU76370.1 water stress/hypersensitive response domain-containing protein [Pseudomonas mangrovi]